MDGLDRLGWAAGIAVVGHGVHVGVRATDPAVMKDVVAALPPGWRHANGPRVDHLFSLVVGGSAADAGRLRRLNLLYRGAVRVARDRDLKPVLESLETEIRRTIAEFAPHSVFVHAGVVGWRGRAILVPGRTFAGKTTLVAELVKAGATYYSDEYAALDQFGQVHPFPKPLSVRDGANRGRDVPAESLGGTCGRHPIPVGAVVVTEYRAGTTWRPRRGSEGEGALALLGNCVSARSKPQHVLAALSSALPGTLVLSGRRGEADQTAPDILRQVEGWFGLTDAAPLQRPGLPADALGRLS